MKSKAPLVIKALKDGPLTAAQLHAITGMTVANATRSLKKLKYERQVHIESWIRPDRSPRYAAVWELGFGPDAAKPAITEAMKKAKRNARQQADRARACAIAADHAIVPHMSAIQPQNPFSALFG